MDKLKIVGGQKLSGSIPIEGAKNTVLLLMAASLLTKETLKLSRVPNLVDTQSLIQLLNHLGTASEENLYEKTLDLTSQHLLTTEAPYDMVRKMRASVLVLGPLLARFGEAKVSLPGGCAIGVRPIDYHIEGLRVLGADINVEGGYVYAKAPKGLKGNIYTFPQKTVTGTANVLMAATLAEGTTHLKNVAREPEVVDLGRCLQKMGARIEGLGTDTLVIKGVSSLKGTSHVTLPDRIETGTYILAAAITGSEIFLENATLSTLSAFAPIMKKMGTHLEETPKGIRVKSPSPTEINSIPQITTGPFPEFATDLQAQMMAFLTQTQGTCKITETIFENRFMHVGELLRMDANIHIAHNTATITGSTALKGAPLMATDIRASACLVLAALAAEGESTIQRIYHLDRGYAHMHEKLRHLGANIERISDNPKPVNLTQPPSKPLEKISSQSDRTP